ncbi:MAG: putative filamentous hemagglutinin/adhesin [Caulobacteraceae bacterium]|nr:putative filamentous hemagglutinin/adhesin [Caulobacteraceae bacterium]
MRITTALLAPALSVMGLSVMGLALSAGAASAQSLEIRDAVARVTVIPEARSDIKVEILTANGQLPLQVRGSGQKVTIDGNLGRRIRGCDGEGKAIAVRVAGVGKVTYAQMPQVVVRTPRDVRVASGGAVYGTIGRAGNVELGNAGCGDWVIANVDGALSLSEAGSGDMRSGAAGRAKIRLAGSGDLYAGAIRGPVEVDLGGSGDVTVGSVNGMLDVKIAGSGDVEVKGGHATAMTTSVAGSGSVTFDGVADTLKVRVAGSGDVNVQQVTGEVSRSVLGSGELRIGGREVARRP